MNERESKLAILTGLAGNYSATLAPETSKMWLFLLKDYSVEQVQAAALNVIRKRADVPYKSMPPFAMMQAELDQLDGTVRGEANIELQAEAEWNLLLESISEYGSWRTPALCPVTERVVRMMGGWQVVCSWLEKDLNWRHKEFVELWQQVQGKEEFLALGADAVAILALPSPERKQSMEQIQFKRQKLLEHMTADYDVSEEREKEKMEVALKAYQEAFHKPYQSEVKLTPEQESFRAKLCAMRDLRQNKAFRQEAVA